jgi:site-specific recombinase XerD
MMDSFNTPRPTTRTLAVIDGGLNVKAPVYPLSSSSGKPKLLEQVHQMIRKRHYSDRTEKAYIHWVKRFIFFHNKRHTKETAEAEIALFLSSLATEGRVSASTQNQALNALLFLYHEVLNKKIGLIDGVVRAKRPLRLPVVLTKEEVKKVIDRMNGATRLMAILLYGGGLRLVDAVVSGSKISTSLETRSSFERAKVIKTVTRRCQQRSRNLFTNISKRIDPNIKKILERGLAEWLCRML